MKIWQILKNIPADAGRKLVSSFGGATHLERALAANPYAAVREGGGTLEVADKIAAALKLGIRDKVLGHVEWALTSRSSMKRGALITKLRFALELSASRVASALDAAIASGQLVALGADIMTKKHHEDNLRVAEEIKRRGLPSAMPLDFGALSGDLDETQLEAVLKAAKHRLSVVTGPPGTGKSHVVRAITAAVPNSRVTAPTGRAARNASGKTIHHFKTIQESGRNDFFDVLLVIVDEASMLSIKLFCAVLDMVPENAHVVLVGDVDQLPPIDAGDVLRDVIDCGLVPVTVLQGNKRCENDELITFARGILDGRVDVAENSAVVQFVDCETSDQVIDKAPWYTLSPERMILTPHNMTRVALNAACQLAAFAHSDELEVSLTDGTQGVASVGFTWPEGTGHVAVSSENSPPFRSTLSCARQVIRIGVDRIPGAFQSGDVVMMPGDRIIVTKNTPAGACNGDVGRFVRKTNEGCLVTIDGKDITIPPATSHDPGLTLAYAITVHKSQGSEFDDVVLPVTNVGAWDRSLLYTAATRAKKRLYILGTRRDLELIVASVRPPRPSLLRDLLR